MVVSFSPVVVVVVIVIVLQLSVIAVLHALWIWGVVFLCNFVVLRGCVLGVGEYGVECGQLVFSILFLGCRICSCITRRKSGWSSLSFCGVSVFL